MLATILSSTNPPLEPLILTSILYMTKIGRGHGIPAKVNSFDPEMVPGSFLYKKEPGYTWLYSLHA